MNLPENEDRILLLHNPRCSKSRAALGLLEESGVVFHLRRYLDDPLDQEELRELARRLGRPVAEWVRDKEAEYAAAGLGPDSDEDSLYAALVRHPVLMERPIVVRGARAVVGRPTEKLRELL